MNSKLRVFSMGAVLGAIILLFFQNCSGPNEINPNDYKTVQSAASSSLAPNSNAPNPAQVDDQVPFNPAPLNGSSQTANPGGGSTTTTAPSSGTGNLPAPTTTPQPPAKLAASLYVGQLYKGLLERMPTDDEQTTAGYSLTHGGGCSSIARDLMSTRAYRNLTSKLSTTRKQSDLYLGLLGRAATQAELNAARYLGTSGLSEQILTSVEFATYCAQFNIADL